MATLENLGTATGYDLPEEGPSPSRTRIIPALLPEDPPARFYAGEIDVSTIAEGPYARNRILAENYPFYWTGVAGGSIGQGFTTSPIDNLYGFTGSSGDITQESTTAYSTLRNMAFPGVASNYLSVPDAANLDITTSIEIVFRVAIHDPLNRLGNQRIVAKSGSARGYEVYLGYDSQMGTLNFTPDGTQTATSTQKIQALPGHPAWYRVTYNSTTDEVKFYWTHANNSVSEPVGAWHQLGDTITITNVMPVNAETLKIGTYNGVNDMFYGRLYNLIIRDADTAGTTVLNIDIAADTLAMTQDVTTTFTATSGQTVTLNKSGTPPNTVRIVPVGDLNYNSLMNGQVYGYLNGVDELVSEENQMQIIWAKVTLATYSTTRRTLYPIIQVYDSATDGGPFQANSWGLYFDTQLNLVFFSARIGTPSHGLETFTSTFGVAAPNNTPATYVFGVALIERNGSTYAWPFRYTASTGVFIDPSVVSDLGVQITGTDLIGASPNLTLWKGYLGFTLDHVGIATIPDVVVENDLVRFAIPSADVDIADIIERHMNIIVYDEDPNYREGDYWRASSDGSLEGAPYPVEEGDLIISLETGNIPQWSQIKFNDPTRRKALLRGRGSTFGYASAPEPISVAANEDIFMWWVMALHGTGSSYWVDEYPVMANDSVENGYIYGNVWYDGDYWRMYMEMENNGNNFGWFEGEEEIGTLPTLFPNGHSSPTLFAMALDKSQDKFVGWIYNPDIGFWTYDNEESGMTFTADDMDLDIISFFGPEVTDDGPDTVYWGGGWLQGVGIVPDETGIARLWEQAVYGYSSL